MKNQYISDFPIPIEKEEIGNQKQKMNVIPKKALAGAQSSSSPEPFFEWKYEMNEKTGRYEFKALELSDGTQMSIENFFQTLKRTTGSSDSKVAEKILNKISYGMTAERQDQRINDVSALLPALRPQDETETLLLGQFLTLQDAGMKCLRNASLSEQGFYHIERFYLLAHKLLNTANQTMQALLKYRSGGQQVVQVVHVYNEGQAIVAQHLAAPSKGEGPPKKNTS